MKLLTRRLVEDLDGVVASQIHPLQRQDITKLRFKNNNEIVGERKIKGVELSFVALGIHNTHFVSPYLTINNNEIPFEKGQWNYLTPKQCSFIAFDCVARQGNTLEINLAPWGGAITSKNLAIEFEQGIYQDATLIQPIPFDPTKEWMFVKSKSTLEGVLHQEQIHEDIELGKWMIAKGVVYEYQPQWYNPDANKKWSRRYFQDNELIKNLSYYLNLFIIVSFTLIFIKIVFLVA